MMSYNASTVPILQLSLSSPTLSEQELSDLGMNYMRSQLATVAGAAVPWPFGGKTPQVMVDINPALLQANGLSPQDVVNAVSAAEPDSAGRHGQNRRLRIQRGHERQPAHGCRNWRTCP